MLLNKSAAVFSDNDCYIWKETIGSDDIFYIAGPTSISVVSSCLYDCWLETELVNPESYRWFSDAQLAGYVEWRKNFIEDLNGLLQETIATDSTIAVWKLVL